MSTSVEPILGLILPVPGTKEPWNTVTENNNKTKITGAIGAKTVRTSTTGPNNSAAEQQLIGLNVPANGPVVGSVYLVVVSGTYDAAAAQTLTIRGKFGNTTFSTLAIATVVATNQAFRWQAELTCITTGAAATWRFAFSGLYKIGATATPTIEVPTAVTTKNITVNQTLEITAQWTAANVANIVRADAGYGYRLTNA